MSAGKFDVLIDHLPVYPFVVVWRHVVAVAVDPDGIVKGFDVLPDQGLGSIVVGDTEAVQPLTLD